jgi:hypothetical protein
MTDVNKNKRCAENGKNNKEKINKFRHLVQFLIHKGNH